MELVIAILALLAVVGLAIVGYYVITSIVRKLEGKNVNMALFVPKQDCTTLIPVPIHASTCDHKWDIITDHKLEMPHEQKTVTILSCCHCGLIDKTVQITSPLPPPEPPAPPEPCKHDWQVQIDQSLEVGHEQKAVVVMTCRLCGEVDKTVEATSPMKNARSECRHIWETEKKVELLSAYEQMLKSVSVKDNYSSKAKIDPNSKLNLDLNQAPAWMFRKTYISLRICSECGEIDKTITSNFELTDDQTPAGDMSEVPEVSADEDDEDRVIKIKQKRGT